MDDCPENSAEERHSVEKTKKEKRRKRRIGAVDATGHEKENRKILTKK